MKSVSDPAFDTEPAQVEDSVPGPRLPIRYDAAVWVKAGRRGLEYVKVLRGPHAEADVALQVARLVVSTLLAGSMLWKVL